MVCSQLKKLRPALFRSLFWGNILYGVAFTVRATVQIGRGGLPKLILILILISEKVGQIACRAGGVGVIWEMPKRKGVFFLGSLPLKDTTGGLPCQILPNTPPSRSRTLLPLWGGRNLFSARDWGKRPASHSKVSNLIEWCDRSIMLKCLTTLHKPSEMASSSEVIKIGGSLHG